LLPVITGLSYELIRFAAKRRGSFLALLTAPGLWLQRITTQPPSNEQTEVAICALDHAMALETSQGGELVVAQIRMQFRGRVEQTERRFDELTRLLAHPASISDADQSRKAAKANSAL